MVDYTEITMQDLLKLNDTHGSVFNFSLSKAINIIEEHSINNQIFTSEIETIIIVLYALIMISGLFCNLVVSSVVLSNAKVRNSRNALVVNLNLSDIILCVFCMPFTLLVLIRRSWFLGNFLCKLVPFIQASTVFVAASTVSAIAIDRCMVVLSFNPQRPRRAQRDLLLSGFFIWAFSLLLSLPMCIYRGTITVGVHGLLMYHKCVEQFPSATFKGVYTILTLIAQFVIPAIMLLITHIQVRHQLNSRTFRQRDNWSNNSNQESSDERGMSDERLKRELKRNTRATMVLLSITVVFAISWLPWHTVNLIADFYPNFLPPKSLYLAFSICHMVAMTSSISNPILYGWLNSNIRREMINLGWTVAKAGSALMSSRSSHTENMAVQNCNILARSSKNEDHSNKHELQECCV